MWAGGRGQLGEPCAWAARGNFVAGALTLACIVGILVAVAAVAGRPVRAAAPPVSARALEPRSSDAPGSARGFDGVQTAVPFPHPTMTFSPTYTPNRTL